MAIKLYIGDSERGLVIGYTTKPETQIITNLALDGTPYVQSPSEFTDKRKINVYCPTYEDRQALDSASNTGKIINLFPVDSERVFGYIEKNISWKEWKDGHGVGAFTMIVKERVVE